MRFSENVTAKAKKIAAEDIEQQDDDGRLWRVRSARTGKKHTVQFIDDDEGHSWVTCTCQHGRTYGGQAGCYHAAAAHLARTDAAEVGPDEKDTP